MVKKVDSFQDLVKEPKYLLHKKETQHEMQWMSDAPNNGMCHKSVIEYKEIKKQIPGMVGKDSMQVNSFPCGSPINLAHKKNGTWGMCVNFKVSKSGK